MLLFDAIAGDVSMSDGLIEQLRDGVLTLTLNRPERKNALTPDLGWALVDAVDRASNDDSVRVIVVTGGAAGPKAAFCSGADLAPASGDDERERTTNEILDDKDWIGEFLLAVRARCESSRPENNASYTINPYYSVV